MPDKKLWAPWRLEYIKAPSKDKCVICEISASDEDIKNYVIKRGKLCFSFLNIYPYINGHIMVAPYRHVAKFNDLKQDEVLEIIQLVRCAQEKVRQTMNPEGFNVGFNEGKAAGAGIHEHIHLHVVPRWVGDTNFMPVTSDTKVISESLDSVYKKLTKV